MDQAVKKKRFSELVVNHLSALNRFALSLCKNEFDANDLVSETIVKAFENFDKLMDESKMKSWLFKILSNQFITDFRIRKRLPEIKLSEIHSPSEEAESFSLFEELSQSDFIASGDPEISFISGLTQIQIEQALKELPDEFRTTLELCDVEDFT